MACSACDVTCYAQAAVMPCGSTSCSNTCSASAAQCAANGCAYNCSNSCVAAAASCAQNCAASCTSSCLGSCTDSCNNGCTGSNYTTVYTNLTFSTLIKSSEILDLKNMIINETTRRNKTAENPNTENIGSTALFTTLESMFNNISLAITTSTSVSAPSTTPTQGSKLTKSEIEEYLTAAKALYSCLIGGSTI